MSQKTSTDCRHISLNNNNFSQYTSRLSILQRNAVMVTYYGYQKQKYCNFVSKQYTMINTPLKYALSLESV